MKKTVGFGVVLLVGMSAAGCAQSSPEQSAGDSELKPSATISLASLRGQWEGADAARNGEDLRNFSSVTMTVNDDGAFQVTTGCNDPRGTFTVNDDGILSIDGPVITTRMACDPALMDMDTLVTDVLESISGATLSESGELQIVGDHGALTFQRE